MEMKISALGEFAQAQREAGKGVTQHTPPRGSILQQFGFCSVVLAQHLWDNGLLINTAEQKSGDRLEVSFVARQGDRSKRTSVIFAPHEAQCPVTVGQKIMEAKLGLG